MDTEKPVSLSVFFPAYNEEANIENSVAEAEMILKKLGIVYEIIIVNDGSRDKTAVIADRLAAENDCIKVVHHHPNRGYGAALWSGIQAARYQYVFFTDADLQFDLSELAILMHFVPEYKVVLGYRAPRRDPFLRLLNAKAWNFLNRFLFGLKVKDIDCAFKLMDRELVASLPIKTRGAMMTAEMLIRLQRRKVVFKEIPVSHFPRVEGEATGAKPEVILRAFKELWVLFKGRLGAIGRRQLVRFAAVGVANTLIDLGLYYVLTRTVPFFSVHMFVAKALSFLTGTVFSFFVNRIWTFKKQTPLKTAELIRFYLSVGVALLINLLSLSFFTKVLHLYDLIGVIGATVVTFVWNFIASKLWVYAESVPIKRPRFFKRRRNPN
jgi:glycosyltransferase involved in cell wall biosynthesis